VKIGFGLCVLVRLERQQSCHCWTIGGGFFDMLVRYGSEGELD